jgi:hypothetical protein
VNANLKVLQQFLGKSDGKDKLCATVQYALMFASAGQPGQLNSARVSIARARKVFRVGKPLMSLMPALATWHPTDPAGLQLLARLKALLMANYFLFDHLVWTHHAGLQTDANALKRTSKISLYSWMFGSATGMLLEAAQLVRLSKSTTRLLMDAKDTGTRAQVKAEAEATARKRMLTFVACTLQTTLASGLLQVSDLSPRTCGAIGVLNSALGCYMQWPAAPAPAAKTFKAA